MRESIFPKYIDNPIGSATPAGAIIAFDPSSCEMGYAVLRPLGSGGAVGVAQPIRVQGLRWVRFESGVWRPSKAIDAPDRFEQLAEFTAKLVMQHAGPVLPRVVIEMPSGGIRPGRVHAMHAYHMAIGAVIAAVRLAPVGTPQGVSPVQVPVNTWKGRKRKEQTQREVQLELGYWADDDNEADALGLACWFAHNAHQLHLIRAINASSGGAKIPKREAGPFARLRAVLRNRASR